MFPYLLTEEVEVDDDVVTWGQDITARDSYPCRRVGLCEDAAVDLIKS